MARTKTPTPASVTITPLVLADLMTDPTDAKHGLGTGRSWSRSDGAKRVRSIARDTIDRFINRTGRTSHVYSMAEAALIVAEDRKGGSGGGTSADAIRAASAPKPASKPASKRTRKPAASPQDGPSDAEGTDPA